MDDFEKSDRFSNKELLEKRKKELFNKINEKKNYLIYIILAIIAYFGYQIRTKNLYLLKEKIPLALDPHVFLRYARYLLEHGQLMAIDTMRYHPFGYAQLAEFRVLTYFMVYFYKFLNFFSPNITLEKAVLLYPAILFVVGLVFFFLLIKKIFDWRIALLASAFLTVLPSYLYRTMAGFSDKEALAMALMFATFYFLVSAWKSKDKFNKMLIFALCAGLANGIMGIVWGGSAFSFIIIGGFTLVQIFLNKFDKKDFYIYTMWMVVFMLIMAIGYPERYSLMAFFNSYIFQIVLFAFLAGFVNYLFIQKNYFKVKEKIKNKLPFGIFCILVSLLLGFIFIWITKGFSALLQIFSELYIEIVQPFGKNKWALTVAENKQPYFVEWIAQSDWKYMGLMFAGGTVLFYEAIKRIKKNSLKLSAVCLGFLLLFTMSRYSQQSQIFNGESGLSTLLYLGSLLVFFGVIVYGYFNFYKKDKEAFKSLTKIKMLHLFVFIWFIVMLVAARGAIRLHFIFAPISALIVAYGGVKLFDYSIKYVKQDWLKISIQVLLVLVLGLLLFNFSQAVSTQATYTGPSYNVQWENAMNWVKENTPEDAVFGHWWDYGYWVQTGAERATLSDGGNAKGNAINYFFGRHVLTGHSEIEALEYLKARNATHLLMIQDEIGKYPAYSSIGSDENYDRYSWIPTFHLEENQIQETRNATIYVFRGGVPVDHDIIYQDRLFPARNSYVAGAFFKVSEQEISNNGTSEKMMRIEEPHIMLVYNNQQIQVPVSCLYFNERKFSYDDPNAIDACLRVVPKVDQTGQNPFGAVLYLSPEVAKSNFARLFLMDESEHFDLVYSDADKGMPLVIYQGRLIGPLKIWKINYPDNLTIPQEYYGLKAPEGVEKVRKDFS